MAIDTPPPQSGSSNTASTHFGDEFTLTSADQPNLQLSSFPLDKTNWTSWRIDVKQTLIIKLKISFVNGTILPSDLDDPSYINWKCIDCLVLKWLRNSTSPEIGRQFVHNSSARSLWIELEDFYGKMGGPRILQLKKRIANFSQGCRLVTSYYSELKMMWSDFRALNPHPTSNLELLALLNKADDKDLLLQYLSGLNDDYTYVSNQILLTSPLPTVSCAHGMVCTAEAQKRTQESREMDSGTSFALATTEKNQATESNDRNSNHPTCAYCKKIGHTKDKCFQLANKNSFCDHCKKSGHTNANCFQLTGVVPDWYKVMKDGRKTKPIAAAALMSTGVSEKSDNSETSSAFSAIKARILAKLEELMSSKGSRGNTLNTPLDFAAGVYEMASSSFSSSCGLSDQWLLDSGASCHLCAKFSLLVDPKHFKSKSSIYLPDAILKTPSHIGSILLADNLIIPNVLFVPGIVLNLISIGQLCRDLNCKGIFDACYCILQDQTSKRWLLKASLLNKLYICNSSSSKIASSYPVASAVNNYDSATAWHYRLGHPSHIVMSKLGLHFDKDPCDICQCSKIHRLPFSDSMSHTLSLFDLVHCDLWGPFNLLDRSKCRYILTIVDDSSRATWLYLLQSKSDTFGALSSFISYVYTQFSCAIKVLRTDNGTKFCNKKCNNLFSRLGIVHQTSCIYTPQQNGIVERKHQHLVQVARSLVLTSGISKTYWGDAMLASAYIINRLPTKTLEWKSPCEVLLGNKPDISNLHSFGCLCFVRVSTLGLGKLEPRGIKGVNLGVAASQKGFKVLLLDTKKVVVSKDVVFYDTIFPYKNPVDSNPVSTSNAYPSPPSYNHVPSTEPPTVVQHYRASPSEPTVYLSLVHSPIILSRSLSNTHSTFVASPQEMQPENNSNDVSSDTSTSVDSSSMNLHPSNLCTTMPHVSVSNLPTRPRREIKRSAKYNYYICSSTTDLEHVPQTFDQANGRPHWDKAIEAELNALKLNHTWDVVKLPQGKKTIGCKWVFQVKQNPNRSINKYKARLVAKGFHQRFWKRLQ